MGENVDLGTILAAIDGVRKDSDLHNSELRKEIKADLKEFRESCTGCNNSLHTRISGNSTKISKIRNNQFKWLSFIGFISFLIASFADSIALKLGF